MITFIVLGYLVSCVASGVMVRPQPAPSHDGWLSYFYKHGYLGRRLGWSLIWLGMPAALALLGLDWCAMRFASAMASLDELPPPVH